LFTDHIVIIDTESTLYVPCSVVDLNLEAFVLIYIQKIVRKRVKVALNGESGSGN